jgi:hypothetical protein
VSYRCGVGPLLAKLCGLPGPQEPHIICDGCGLVRSVYRSRNWYGPAAWFLAGRHAPGWTGGRNEDGTRTDYCPACSGRHREPPPDPQAEEE